MPALLFGVDIVIQQQPIWKQQRIGLVTNEAATTRNLVPSRLALQRAGFNIVQLFSPEHGLNVKGADGAPMLNGIDELTDLPVISLYGDKLAPTEEDLTQIDLLLFDIPDIGVRFYTYLWTLSYLLEVSAQFQKPLIVLDRPNPISGDKSLIEGPLLSEATASFIGRWPMPLRHSKTLGELAKHFNETRNIHAPLTIIDCAHWNRESFLPDWQIPFIATSPAIQSFESMLLYPGLCLLEATNLSEGRGTEYSFEVVAAPWLNSALISAKINGFLGDEIVAKPLQLIPSDAKFAGEICQAVHFTVKDKQLFKPVFFGLILIRLIKDIHPQEFAWSRYKTHVNPEGTQHLDKLLGVVDSEAMFELPLATFLKTITSITQPHTHP